MPVTAPKFRNQFHVSYAPAVFGDAPGSMPILTESSLNIQTESSQDIGTDEIITVQKMRVRQVALNTFHVIVKEST